MMPFRRATAEKKGVQGDLIDDTGADSGSEAEEEADTDETQEQM